MAPTKLTPRELRRIAEHVLGVSEDRRLCYLEDPASGVGKAGWHLLEPDDSRVTAGCLEVGPDELVDSPARGEKPRYAPPEYVAIKCPKMEAEELVKGGYDAAFWSRPAMEKFLLAYYLPLKSPEDFALLYQLIMGGIHRGTLFAILHTFPSIETRRIEAETAFLTDEGIIPEQTMLLQLRNLVK